MGPLMGGIPMRVLAGKSVWPTRAGWLALAAGCLLLSGCPSMVTDYEPRLLASVEGDRAGGPGPGQVFIGTRPAGAASPFAPVGFADDWLRIEFRLGNLGIWLSAENTSASRLVLRWDRATISSDTAPAPVMLRTQSMAVDGKSVARSGGKAMVALPALDLLPGSRHKVDIVTGFGRVFPGRTPFGIPSDPRATKVRADLRPEGTLILALPVECKGRTVVYRFAFTAVQARQRRAYY